MIAIAGLFDITGFPPRWKCGSWPPALGWTHIISDLAIFGAYMAIPIGLASFVLRRRNVPFPFLFWLFVAFILSCGVTHLIEAIIFYKPIYRFAGVMKAITAVVSVTTVIMLVRAMPAALRLPDIQAANKRLEEEALQRTKIQRELETARTALEGRTGELTLQSHRIERAMEAAWVVACQWVADSGQIVWEIGARRWMKELFSSKRFEAVTSWGEILSPEQLSEFIRESRAAVEEDREMEYQTTIETPWGQSLVIRLGGSPDQRVTGAPPTLTGMARLI